MLSDMLRLYGVQLLDRPQDERRATLERLDLGADARGGAVAGLHRRARRCGRRRRSAASRACSPNAATRRTGRGRRPPWVRVGNGRPAADADRKEGVPRGRRAGRIRPCGGRRGSGATAPRRPARGGRRDGAGHLAGGRRPRRRGHAPAAAAAAGCGRWADGARGRRPRDPPFTASYRLVAGDGRRPAPARGHERDGRPRAPPHPQPDRRRVLAPRHRRRAAAARTSTGPSTSTSPSPRCSTPCRSAGSGCTAAPATTC